MPARHSCVQVKGKGEMLTYYVDLTDELFLVEKRRHGDDEEEEDEEEQQWEELRFLWLNVTSLSVHMIIVNSVLNMLHMTHHRNCIKHSI